eukprot:2909462-Prymnesium_polylepis.1
MEFRITLDFKPAGHLHLVLGIGHRAQETNPIVGVLCLQPLSEARKRGRRLCRRRGVAQSLRL